MEKYEMLFWVLLTLPSLFLIIVMAMLYYHHKFMVKLAEFQSGILAAHSAKLDALMAANAIFGGGAKNFNEALELVKNAGKAGVK